MFINLIFSEHIEWTDSSKKRCHIYWRRVEEWAQLLLDWAVSSGFVGSVLTFADIIEDEVNHSQCKSLSPFKLIFPFFLAFYNLDHELLLKALQHLKQRGKAELIDVGGTIGGVKFIQ